MSAENFAAAVEASHYFGLEQFAELLQSIAASMPEGEEGLQARYDAIDGDPLIERAFRRRLLHSPQNFQPMRDLPVLVIDGATFSDFEGFTWEFSRMFDDYTWRGHMDAFNDILHGGFGTPDGLWTLRWLNSGLSRSALGYDETVRHLEGPLQTCHPSHRQRILDEISRAQRGQGPTLFDDIVETIRGSGLDYFNPEDGVFSGAGIATGDHPTTGMSGHCSVIAWPMAGVPTRPPGLRLPCHVRVPRVDQAAFDG